MNFTSTGNVNSVVNYDIKQWAIEELLPGNFDYATSQVIQQSVKFAKDNGMEFFLDLMGVIFDQRMYQAQTSFMNQFGVFKSVFGEEGQKADVFKKAQQLDMFKAHVAENPDKTFDENVNTFLDKMVGYEERPESFRDIVKWVNTASKKSEKLQGIWKGSDFLKQTGFAYSLSEKGPETLQKLRDNPEIYAAFTNFLTGLIDKNPEAMDLKKVVSGSMSTPANRSVIWDAMAVSEKNNRYENSTRRLIDTLLYDPKAVDGQKWWEKIATIGEVDVGEDLTGTQAVKAVDFMESVLAWASKDAVVSEDVFRSIQEATAKKGNLTRIEEMVKQGLIDPKKYQNIMKAFVRLQDDSTVPYTEAKDQEVGKFDYSILGAVSNYDGKEAKKIMDEAKDTEPKDTPENATIENDLYGAVMVKKDNIVLQDVMGRVFTCTNVDTPLKTGDVVKPGTPLGTARKGGSTVAPGNTTNADVNNTNPALTYMPTQNGPNLDFSKNHLIVSTKKKS